MSKKIEVEPLTIAYLAIGALDAIPGTLPADVCDRFSGQLGYIDAVIHQAELLERLAKNRQFDGVFVYDVAEEFGRRYGKALIEDAPIDPKALAQELIDANASGRK